MANNLQLRVLTDEEVGNIYDKCLGLLSSKGVKVDHKEALKILEKAGAQVDFNSWQVRFPRDIIEAALHSLPHRMTLGAGNKRHDLILPHPSGTFYARGGGGASTYLHPDTNTYSDMTLDGVAECAQLVEILDQMDYCGMLSPRDVPQQTADIHSLKTVLENTSKHVDVQPYSAEAVEYLLQLGLTVAGSTEVLRSRPRISLYCCALTPLEIKVGEAEVMIQSSRYGLPICAASLPSAGGTSPVTVAGTTLLASAEILAIIVISQLIKSGTPVIALPSSYALDMLTGHLRVASVEALLARTAMIQFIKDAYHIPIATAGFAGDSSILDGQNMIEVTLKGLLSSTAGSDILFSAGQLYTVKGFSPVQLVIDNTLVSILRRLRLGVKVNDDTLAWKDIFDTAPGGHFLDRRHTLQHCREALRPELFTDEVWEVWKSQGGRDLYTQALEKYRDLKRRLEPQRLPEEVQKELELIVKRADERLAK